MSIVQESVGKLLVDDIEYIEYQRIDKHKPWLANKIIRRNTLPDSIITKSGINTSSKGNEQEAGSTSANLVTNINYEFKVNSVILDHYRQEAYSIINVRKDHNLDSLDFFAYRLGLEWIDGYYDF